ncbi:MAG: NADH-quinone oxidoreductase subunit J [Candidatus Marinimicrobia bacterium]|nr:NADH-quinone oxidoreductase subunit J [Candidatus Neomarinimicrobiota bacterium]
MSEVFFILIAAITIASAIWVVFSSNLIYSAVALLFTLFGVAGLYVFLYADFIAATQVVVYVGGILVLIIFGVMLTNKIADNRISHSSRPRFMAGVISFFIFVLVMTVIFTTTWHTGEEQIATATVNTIGEMILTTYLLPFEVASLVLLAALMGSALLSRKKHG